MASGDVINYSVRPAKFVERKVIRDMLINLNRFVPISDYKYIGFGSKYFADFSLFHKTLHINDMVSIEGDVENHEKYFFNKPFECIDVIMGMSNDALPKIEYNKKFIAWLDYDFGIDITMLNDVGILIENLVSGSVVMTSYNSIAHKIGKLREEYNDEDSSHKELLIKKLKDLVSDDYIPDSIPETKLAKAETFSKIVRDIFVIKIKNVLSNKNSALEFPEKWSFEQIIYFQYKDGADMATLGWVFYQNKDKPKIESCNFQADVFSRASDESYKINIPNLTVKEVSRLQNAMPISGEINREQFPIEIYSDEDIAAFSKIYKYYPSFMSVEFA